MTDTNRTTGTDVAPEERRRRFRELARRIVAPDTRPHLCKPKFSQAEPEYCVAAHARAQAYDNARADEGGYWFGYEDPDTGTVPADEDDHRRGGFTCTAECAAAELGMAAAADARWLFNDDWPVEALNDAGCGYLPTDVNLVTPDRADAARVLRMIADRHDGRVPEYENAPTPHYG